MSLSFTYQFKLAPTIALAIVFPILISLGFWQLDRADIKQHQLDTFNERSNQPAMLLTVDMVPDNNDVLYKKFIVQGRYNTKQYFLIDNRVHQQQVGFYVISLFNVKDSDKKILVNRGWVKGNRYRADLPVIETPGEEITIQGEGYIPRKNFFAMDNSEIDIQKFPHVIQNIDFTAISEALKSDLYPFILRLDNKDKTGFVRDWKVVTSSPEKSQSYAAQWFTMALVVVLIYLSTCFKLNRKNTR